MKIYLDLDRTLLDTAKATPAIWGEIAERHRIDAHAEDEQQREFYVYSGGGYYYYDFAAHLQSRGLDPHQVAGELVGSEIADNRLLMPGAEEFVETAKMHGEVEILTYGEEYYQRLKAALCPALGGLAVNVTLLPKGVFLADKPNSVIVDDKPIGNGLPEHTRFYQVQLEENKKLDEPWTVYTDLRSVSDEFNLAD